MCRLTLILRRAHACARLSPAPCNDTTDNIRCDRHPSTACPPTRLFAASTGPLSQSLAVPRPVATADSRQCASVFAGWPGSSRSNNQRPPQPSDPRGRYRSAEGVGGFQPAHAALHGAQQARLAHLYDCLPHLTAACEHSALGRLTRHMTPYSLVIVPCQHWHWGCFDLRFVATLYRSRHAHGPAYALYLSKCCCYRAPRLASGSAGQPSQLASGSADR